MNTNTEEIINNEKKLETKFVNIMKNIINSLPCKTQEMIKTLEDLKLNFVTFTSFKADNDDDGEEINEWYGALATLSSQVYNSLNQQTEEQLIQSSFGTKKRKKEKKQKKSIKN